MAAFQLPDCDHKFGFATFIPIPMSLMALARPVIHSGAQLEYIISIDQGLNVSYFLSCCSSLLPRKQKHRSNPVWTIRCTNLIKKALLKHIPFFIDQN